MLGLDVRLGLGLHSGLEFLLRGQRDSTKGGVLALHTDHLSSIPGIPYSPHTASQEYLLRAKPRVSPEHSM